MTLSPEMVFEHDDFEFDTIDEELQADGRCQQVLKQFYQFLQQQGMAAEQASELAFCADLFLRDYIIDFCRGNITRPQPGMVRSFAGSWYITHTLDPEYGTLERHLVAIIELYGYMHRQHLISAEELAFVTHEAEQHDFYRKRIETFMNLNGDQFIPWDSECPARI